MTRTRIAGLGHAGDMNPISEPLRPVLAHQADLEHTWRHLLQPLGFTERSLWLMLVDAEHRPLPMLTEVGECAARPDADLLASFADLAGRIVDEQVPGGSLALLLSRPGAGGPTDDDRAWAHGLVTSCRAVGVRAEVVHLATDVDVVPLPLDALSGAR